ncbi:MAG: pirin family protein [Ignavibacteria bacterium]|nr:pirin family protein [Ignavibacteria bacterium]
MKKRIFRSGDRGKADHGWLIARHSFSFANYYDPEKIRFGTLRVLNDDIVKPSKGFGKHPHDNMEIVTIPLKGELAHEDSTGNKEVIYANEVQIMSAGSGLTHSEFNNSDTEEVNLLQIWVFPKVKDITPRYDQKKFNPEERHNIIQTIVSPEKSENTLWINQNAYFSLSDVDKDLTVNYEIKSKGNGVYVFLIEGKAEIDEEILEKRDAAGIEESDNVEVKALENCRLLFIEVPMN